MNRSRIEAGWNDDLDDFRRQRSRILRTRFAGMSGRREGPVAEVRRAHEFGEVETETLRSDRQSRLVERQPLAFIQ